VGGDAARQRAEVVAAFEAETMRPPACLSATFLICCVIHV
jgi:hypothetical protein